MNPKEIEQKLIQWSAANSGYDEHRPYIGLSGIADCSLVIYRRFLNHTGASTESRLKTRYAYEIEENIKQRLIAIGTYSPGKEIIVYDGLVKGHTDGEFNRDLLEIATVPLTDHIPLNDQIPRKKFWQSQAYMLYGHYDRTVMIYFARDYGTFRVFKIDMIRSWGIGSCQRSMLWLNSSGRRFLRPAIAGGVRLVRPKGASWIITYDGNGKEPFGHKCLRCGAFCTFGCATPIKDFLKISTAFINLHRQCKEKEGPKVDKTSPKVLLTLHRRTR